MSISEITSELKKMSNAERLVVIEIATKLVRGEMEDTTKELPAKKKLSLRESAELMRDEYLSDEELTIFTSSLADEDYYDV
jgi:hypothetical protein